jgi:hypothetical protein
MGLPKQVQRQVEEVRRIEEAMATESGQQVESANAPDAANADNHQPEVVAAEVPKQVEPPVEARPQQQDSEVAKWEHKYKSLANHYTAFAKEQNAKVADLTAKLEEMTKRLEAPKETPKGEKLVTEKDVEQFGDDLIDLQRRVAKEVAAHYEAKIATLEQKLADASDTLGDVSQQNQRNVAERFYASLEAAVPNWEQLQSTQECQDFLSARVAGARFTWNDALMDAANSADAARAVEVFKAFMSAYPSYAPKQAQQPKVNQARSELERQVAPTKSKSATSSVSEKSIYTSSDMDRMTQQMIKLAKGGRHQEAAVIETELNSAIAEGRFKP